MQDHLDHFLEAYKALSRNEKKAAPAEGAAEGAAATMVEAEGVQERNQVTKSQHQKICAINLKRHRTTNNLKSQIEDVKKALRTDSAVDVHAARVQEVFI